MEQYHQTASVLPQFPATTNDVHPNPVANATPTHPQLSSSHPSYAEMITAAILWDSSQGKAGGSSKRAIAKYIDRVYTNLPPTHSALLTHNLKRMKNTGQLVMIKNSYQLPVVAANTASPPPPPPAAAAVVPIRSAPPPPPTPSLPPEPANPTPKKRPGRPAKPKPLAQPSAANLSPPPPPSAQQQPAGNGLSTGKRPRGRPPRQQQQQPVVAEVPFVQPISQTQAQPNYAPDLGLNNGLSVKRRPGRPSKKQQPVQPVSQAPFQPSDQGLAVVPVNGSVPGLAKRRPGRPPRAHVVAAPVGTVGVGPKRRGRPKRNALGPAARPIGKKPRGRPPRQPGAVPGGGVAGGKRRGRPPKGGVGPAKPVRKYAGKPRGRPRKNASIAGKHTSGQRMADEELIRKVEDMQVKVKDAVSVLKPFFTIENSSNDALIALQILEDLSTLNITAPPTAVEPPVSAMPLNEADQPSAPVFAPETVTAPSVVAATIPAPPRMAPQPPPPPVMPFTITAPAMTEPAPFYVPQTMETQQQQSSWMPSGEAQL